MENPGSFKSIIVKDWKCLAGVLACGYGITFLFSLICMWIIVKQGETISDTIQLPPKKENNQNWNTKLFTGIYSVDARQDCEVGDPTIMSMKWMGAMNMCYHEDVKFKTKRERANWNTTYTKIFSTGTCKQNGFGTKIKKKGSCKKNCGDKTEYRFHKDWDGNKSKEMQNFNEMKYCGKAIAAGTGTWVDVIKDVTQQECDDIKQKDSVNDWVSCPSINGTFICVKGLECPVNDVKLVSNAQAKTSDWQQIPFGDDQTLIFRNSSQTIPVTELKVELVAPCQDVLKVSAIAKTDIYQVYEHSGGCRGPYDETSDEIGALKQSMYKIYDNNGILQVYQERDQSFQEAKKLCKKMAKHIKDACSNYAEKTTSTTIANNMKNIYPKLFQKHVAQLVQGCTLSRTEIKNFSLNFNTQLADLKKPIGDVGYYIAWQGFVLTLGTFIALIPLIWRCAPPIFVGYVLVLQYIWLFVQMVYGFISFTAYSKAWDAFNQDYFQKFEVLQKCVNFSGPQIFISNVTKMNSLIEIAITFNWIYNSQLYLWPLIVFPVFLVVRLCSGDCGQISPYMENAPNVPQMQQPQPIVPQPAPAQNSIVAGMQVEAVNGSSANNQVSIRSFERAYKQNLKDLYHFYMACN